MSKHKSIHADEYSTLIALMTSERKRLGLSQVEVGQRIGMSQSDISKIENQERRMDVLEFKRLLEAYRVQENLTLKKLILNYLGLESESQGS